MTLTIQKDWKSNKRLVTMELREEDAIILVVQGKQIIVERLVFRCDSISSNIAWLSVTHGFVTLMK